MRKQRSMWFLLWMAVIAIGIGVLSGCSASNSDAGGSSELKSESSADSGGSTASEGQAGDEAAVANGASEGDAAKGEAAVSSGGASPAGGIGAIADEAGFNRKLIYRANVAMEVADYAKAQSQISSAITLAGGYIVKFNDQQTSSELGGTYTIKVPANGFMSFLTQIEKIAHLALEKRLEGTDVTEEYVDLESRLKARQVVEARLLAFMEKATKADDLLKFSNELGEVQTEIERIKGRMRYLDQNVAFSTVELRIYQLSVTPIETKSEERGFAARVGEAWNGSLSFIGRAAQTAVIVLAALLPVLVVVGLIGGVVYLVYWRRRAVGVKRPASGVQVPQQQKSDRWPEGSDPDGGQLPDQDRSDN